MKNYQFLILLLVCVFVFYYLDNKISSLSLKYSDIVSKYNNIAQDNLLHNNNIDKIIKLINNSIQSDKEVTNNVMKQLNTENINNHIGGNSNCINVMINLYFLMNIFEHLDFTKNTFYDGSLGSLGGQVDVQRPGSARHTSAHLGLSLFGSA